MNVDIFIPARLDSSRLPKKHLQKINNIPIIELLVQRLKRVKNIRNIIVCTTNKESDDELVKILAKKKILYFRGDDTDILKRSMMLHKNFKLKLLLMWKGISYIQNHFLLVRLFLK